VSMMAYVDEIEMHHVYNDDDDDNGHTMCAVEIDTATWKMNDDLARVADIEQ
jgi:hypothetical protein